MQAFALQEVLRRLGHDPITIDYLPNKISKRRYIFAQLKTIFYYLTFRNTRKFFRYPQRIRSPKFQNFMDKYMTLTERVHKYRASILKKYSVEAIIVGSDQVWRGAYHKPSVQPDLFLRFAKKMHIPKIAYAASFGIGEWEYSEALTKECAKYAKMFKAISTREDSGVILCEKYLKVPATAVSDPTLLLDKEDYLGICSHIPYTTEPYLLAYLLDMTEELKLLIEHFAKRNKLSVKFYTSEKNITLSVEEWLAMYRDASFVITNSFHGTVFSIINNKDFYSIVHVDRGADRFVSLLSRFNLSDRMIKGGRELPLDITTVDWESVNQEKEEWKVAGINFLKTNLS